MSDDNMVRVVKTDHLLWRWWVYNSILGYHTLDAAQAGDGALDQLYDNISSKR